MDQLNAASDPPRVTPAEKPLRFPFNVIKMLSNNLEVIPEQAFEQDVVIAPGPPRMAFICGPEAIETVLMKRHGDFPKDRLQNEILEPLFGDAMISSHGKEWRWQRGAAAPLFRHDELLRYIPTMRAAAEATVEEWRNTPEGEPRLINRDMVHAAFSVISRTMLAGGAPEVLASIEKGHATYFRNVNWWVLHRMLRLPGWFPHPGSAAMREREQWLHDAVLDIVRARSKDRREGSDLLARLLDAADPETGQRMPEERLVGNIIAFLVAGFDTTALALTWTLFLISRRPEWVERMREEVARVAGDGPVEAHHLKELVVVEQVLNEALRLYPTAPVILRDIAEDVELAGIRVPAGTIGVIPIYAIHRHKRFWRDPDAFDPARFAPDSGHKPTRYQFLPFGAGPRICIGAAFSVMESKIMLATFVRAADFRAEPGFTPRPTGQMFLTGSGDFPIYVTMRE